MIPVGAIVSGILAAKRATNGGRPDPQANNIGLRVTAAVILIPLSLIELRVAPWIGVPCVMLVGLYLFPALVLSRVLVPLGLARAAYVYARITPPVAMSEEAVAGAVFYSAVAAHRAKKIDAAHLDRLDMHLASPAVRPRGIAVAAAGLIAAARGRRETARLLLASVDVIPNRLAPSAVRYAARSWLVADAAERGDWRHVAALGRGRGSYVRWPYLMGAIAQRLLGDAKAPSRAALVVLFLVAPHRRATLPILRRALAVPRSTSTQHQADPDRDALDHALEMHVAFLRAPTARAVVRAGQAWDAVRASPSAAAIVARRALAVEVSGDVALERMIERVASELAPYVSRVLPRERASSVTLTAAQEHARRLAFDDIETLATALQARHASKTPLNVLSEWCEWSALRTRCERLFRETDDADARRAAFEIVYPASCNYAAWIFNARLEKLLANGIFSWLLTEAKAVGANESVTALLTRNVDAGHA